MTSSRDGLARAPGAEATERAGHDTHGPLTRLGARLLGAPVVIVSLVGRDPYVFSADGRAWEALRDSPAVGTLCRVADAGPVLVNRRDRDAGHRIAQAVADLGVIAYAGVPLHAQDGRVAGSLVAVDSIERGWTADDIERLSDLAALATAGGGSAHAHHLGPAGTGAGATNERVISQVIDTSLDAFVSVNAAGRVTEWNSAAERMFGWPAAEAAGRDVADLLVPAAQRDEYVQAVRRYLEGGADTLAPLSLDIVALHRDRSEIPVTLAAGGLKTSQGWVLNAFLHNRSDRLRAERMTDTFLALVSHELRTPLSSVVAHVELLLDDGEELDESERRGFLETIDRGSARLERLVGDLLFVAHHEAAPAALRTSWVDLTAIAEHALVAARARAESQNVTLVLEAGGSPHAVGDPDRLAQALDNLLANAITFSPGGGAVTVRVSGSEDQAVIEIQDEGIGIARDDQARVFDRFFRASAAADLHLPGVGLGLVIVKQIVEGMGGRVCLQSELDHGTTFRMEFPAARSRPAGAAGERRRSTEAAREAPRRTG